MGQRSNNPLPINLTTPGMISDVGAQVIGSRIHLWVTDTYDGVNSVGYFILSPTKRQSSLNKAPKALDLFPFLSCTGATESRD